MSRSCFENRARRHNVENAVPEAYIIDGLCTPRGIGKMAAAMIIERT